MNITMLTLALVIICSYSYYINKTCSNIDYYEIPANGYIEEVSNKAKRMIWILFMCLAIIFFTVGCIMLRKLRLYYKDFYKEFGC